MKFDRTNSIFLQDSLKKWDSGSVITNLGLPMIWFNWVLKGGFYSMWCSESVLERFEATITSLENTLDLSKITLVELLNALQTREQRRMMWKEQSKEGPLQAQTKVSGGRKKNNEKNSNKTNKNKNRDGINSPCAYYKKRNHLQKSVGGGLMLSAENVVSLDTNLHVTTCKSFTTCNSSGDSWLIGSGNTNYMTNDQKLFKV